MTPRCTCANVVVIGRDPSMNNAVVHTQECWDAVATLAVTPQESADPREAVAMPTRLIRTEWPPTPQLVPGGSDRFDAVYDSLRAGEPIREPLLVRQDTWTIIDGCHRLAAARLLGLATVPVRFWTGVEYIP